MVFYPFIFGSGKKYYSLVRGRPKAVAYNAKMSKSSLNWKITDKSCQLCYWEHFLVMSSLATSVLIKITASHGNLAWNFQRNYSPFSNEHRWSHLFDHMTDCIIIELWHNYWSVESWFVKISSVWYHCSQSKLEHGDYLSCMLWPCFKKINFQSAMARYQKGTIFVFWSNVLMYKIIPFCYLDKE